MKIILTSVTILSILIFTSCGSQKAEEDVENRSTPGEDIEIAELEVGVLTKQLMSEVVECTGEIDIPPSDRASIFTPIGGVLGNINILPGTLVKKGEIVATLQHRDIVKLQQDYLINKSKYDLALLAFERKKELYDKEVSSASDFQSFKSTYEVAQSEVEGLKAQLNMIGISVANLDKNGISEKIYLRSPINGYVAEVHVNTGMYVGINREIMTIINPDHKHVELEVYAKDVALVEPGQHLHFRTTGSTKNYEAEILLIGQVVNEGSRTISVHAHLLDDHPELVVGTHISASIYTEADTVFSLPEEAIFNLGDGDLILIQEDEILSKRNVQLGRSLEGYVEILNYEELLNKSVVIKDAYYFHE